MRGDRGASFEDFANDAEDESTGFAGVLLMIPAAGIPGLALVKWGLLAGVRGGDGVINVSRGRTDFVNPPLGLGFAGTALPLSFFCADEGSPLGGVATADQKAAADVTTPPFPPLAERTSYLNATGSGTTRCATLEGC
jgi:hypothetical protein